MKRALIIGVTGQDGAYLAKCLLSKRYVVWGSSRDAEGNPHTNLVQLGIRDQIKLMTISPEDFRSVVVGVNRAGPDEIYFLAGQTSVGQSFLSPAETMLSNSQGMLNVLEVVRFLGRPIKVFHAGSSEMFGDVGNLRATEMTLPHPRSPYAVAKAAATMLVANYREAYGMFAVTGILFNHESPLRPERFVTQKVVQGVKAIASGRADILTLGRLDIWRDWGWAPEYVDAMWRMMQADTPSDYVVATGKSYSLEEFVDLAFAEAGLDWRDHVRFSEALARPSDLDHSAADPSAIEAALGWKATVTMPEVVRRMMASIL